jgi:lysophospholipase L1-like esterase
MIENFPFVCIAMSKRLTRILIYLLASVVVIIAGYNFVRKMKAHRVVKEYLASEHWLEKVRKYEAEPRTKGHVVFFGNSLTENFNLGGLADTVINRGIGGDFTQGLLQRLNEVISLSPSKLFIEIGINDIMEKVPPYEVINNYEKIIVRLQKELPSTKIYIQSNVPVQWKGSFFTSNESMNKEVVKQNEKLKELAAKYKVTYIDLYPHFVKNGSLNSDYTTDGIHLSTEGYNVWREILKQYV